MKKYILILAAAAALFCSCEKYNDFTTDFDYTAVYFGSQKPLRTVVARRGSENMQIKIGSAIGGLRENTEGYWVDFEIDESLLSSVAGADKFTMMPEDYYRMEVENNRIIIPKGKFLGDFPFIIDREKFTSDPDAVNKTYAIPLRLTDTSADKILEEKDYTIIVIKYITADSGTYYVKGEQTQIDAGGNPMDGTTQVYSHTDLSRNKTRVLTTLSADGLEMAGLGASGDSGTERLKITLTDDWTVTLEQAADEACAIEDLGSSYDAESKTFTLHYIYTKDSSRFEVSEQLILRQDPELDLRYETW